MKPVAVLLPTCAAALLACSAPAFAGAAPCQGAPTSALFAPWADFSQYSPFPGSTFENGASGWSWSGKAKIIGGDDDQLLATSGAHAVEIGASSGAKSPWVCVDSTTPSMRFFVRRVSGAGTLSIKGEVKTADGTIKTTFAVITAGSDWAPSPIIAFPTLVTTALATNGNAQFTFVADAGSVFRIDDIELDPFKSI